MFIQMRKKKKPDHASLHSCPLTKHHLQISQIHSKVIFGLSQNPRSILPRRESRIESRDQTSREGSKFHQSQVLTDTAEGAHGEGCKGVFVLDFFFLTIPAFGEEFFRLVVEVWVCGRRERRNLLALDDVTIGISDVEQKKKKGYE